MNLDTRTLQVIIGILEMTIKNLCNARDGLPRYAYMTVRKEHLNGQIEALEEVVKMLRRLLEDQS